MNSIGIDRRGNARGPAAILALAICVVCAAPDAGAATALTLAEAERLALADDPALRSLQAREGVFEAERVAAGQLPDPKLRFGFMSLPTDSFDLDQEPMTQLQVGVMQEFPRGDTRSLRGEQLRERGQATAQRREDLALRTRRVVRETYLEVLKQQRLGAINREAERAFADLAAITEDYYATGDVPQQDVLRATVELARVEERSQRLLEAEERARATLATWVGDAAWGQLPEPWPTLPSPAPRDAIIASLSRHPRLLALHREALAAETGVALAKQAYKPGFAVDLTYGARDGMNMDGSDRPDLLSFMVTMDLPLFREDRQDRLAAARIAESAAASLDRDDAHRRLRAEVELQARTLERQRERLRLFEETLLPDAAFNADSAFDAYRQALVDLTALMRARITEYDLQLEHAALEAELLKTRARLLYLQGESS